MIMWKPKCHQKTCVFIYLSNSTSCLLSSISTSSTESPRKAESPDEAKRPLSSDNPRPVDTDRACRKSTEDICELLLLFVSRKSCSFGRFLKGSSPQFQCRSRPPPPSSSVDGPGARPTTLTAPQINKRNK
ncbi:hypothetical protein Leryth_008734 [Lithospermum erythrorhizon]|nr:hypothetical protein Leryth_008734 [Lithospermum erythrorhizon]